MHAQAQYVSPACVRAELALSGEKLFARSPPGPTIYLYPIKRPTGFRHALHAQARHRYRICAGSARPVLGWDHACGTTATSGRRAYGQGGAGWWESTPSRACKAISAEGSQRIVLWSALLLKKLKRL